MGMKKTSRLFERLRLRADNCYWRARYWWMDTDSGEQARTALGFVCALVMVVQLLRVSIAATETSPANLPQEAIYWWVVQLIIAVVAAAVMYALQPKPEKPQIKDADGPTVEDGRAGIYFWGTHWMNDIHLIAWKIVGRDAIKGKSGK